MQERRPAWAAANSIPSGRYGRWLVGPLQPAARGAFSAAAAETSRRRHSFPDCPPPSPSGAAADQLPPQSGGISSALSVEARGTKQSPPGNPAGARRAPSIASRVLPMTPGPTRVSSRQSGSANRVLISASSFSRPMSGVMIGQESQALDNQPAQSLPFSRHPAFKIGRIRI